MAVNAKLIEVRPSEECGCPEEFWIMDNIEVIIHFEEDGSGHIFLDAGDWDHDFVVEANTMEGLRRAAIDWVESLPK
jgi:hypothetical protein